MKLKLDVVNKWQEPPEEVETIKFWVLPDEDGTVDVGVTLPDGTEMKIGYFILKDNKINLALWSDLPGEYFNSDDFAGIYTY